MGRTWPVGTASGIGAIAGGTATDWIGASSSMDGFGRIRSDGRGHLISPEVDGGGSVRERATVVIVDAVHRRIVETLLHLRPVAQIRYSRGWHSEENKSRMLRCLTEISPSHIAGNAGRPAH
uniref:Uncharacterized protein n=1 Tax=Oryza sativa subsp. japonica TaxID=39947 RepID=Q2R3D6_ORYSJ|nr:hypothetical protein LOC_Os11g32300 [Oryza sativa Japonica Group]